MENEIDELDGLLDPSIKSNTSNTISGDKLPNANATLTLGIISIVGCILYAIPGLVCGIIALALHKKDKAIYSTDPNRFENSYKNAKAGFICAIIGTSLSALYVLFIIFFVLFAVSTVGSLGRF